MPFEPQISSASSATTAYSNKSRVAAILLCLCFGWMGIHRFYIGRIGTGILMMLTVGFFGLWTLIDLYWAITGQLRDGEGRRVFRWYEEGSI